jgi:hypothetical protein
MAENHDIDNEEQRLPAIYVVGIMIYMIVFWFVDTNSDHNIRRRFKDCLFEVWNDWKNSNSAKEKRWKTEKF